MGFFDLDTEDVVVFAMRSSPGPLVGASDYMYFLAWWGGGGG